MITVGDRLRRARKRFNLTISQLNKLTGLSVGNISDLENNKNLPSVSALIPLSKALNVSIDWLLTGHEFQEYDKQCTASESGYENIGQLIESEIDMINKFRQLDLRDQEEAKAIIDMKYQRKKEND